MRSEHKAFWRGVLASSPFLIVIVPFGLLFGVVATDAGLTPAEVLAFSLVVIAGAAQFVALQLMTDGAPVAIVIVTALAVNMRMAMYSAALTPHLGAAPAWQRALMAYLLVDQAFAAASADYAARPAQTLAEKVAFYFGSVAVVVPLWYASSWGGAVFGRAIPPEYALDFAVPIAFLAITAPMIRTRAHLAAAVVSVTVALLLVWMPYSSGLLVAAVLAMVAGALVEGHDERAAARKAR